MELRAKLRDEAIEEAVLERNAARDTLKDRKKSEDRTADSCLENPERALVGREKDIAELRKEVRETGYMHTHPVTQERIRAAEAAATR